MELKTIRKQLEQIPGNSCALDQRREALFKVVENLLNYLEQQEAALAAAACQQIEQGERQKWDQ